MHLNVPTRVKLVEVAPRDGLQNERTPIDADLKVELIHRLVQAGLRHVEAGSFVSPKAVPQMADSDEVLGRLSRQAGVSYSALTPNMKGFERALDVRANEVAVFAAASDVFSQKNINCSIAESLERFAPVLEAAREQQVPVRGYISCVLGCPYEGAVTPAAVRRVAEALWQMGCHEISLGDTIGVGTPGKMLAMLNAVAEAVPLENLAVHCHDTYGQALPNILAALQAGVAVVDASVSGLGGCPYAPGASGNVATEDVVYMLDGLGVETGVRLNELVQVGDFISAQLSRPNGSRVARAMAKVP